MKRTYRSIIIIIQIKLTVSFCILYVYVLFLLFIGAHFVMGLWAIKLASK
jgi:hypothetical protein